jgi:hypothetical protein
MNGVTVKVVNVPGSGIQPSTTSGQRVHLDPKTGKIREAEQEELAEFREAVRGLLDRPLTNLQPVQHPNGMISLDLKGSFLEFSTATVGPNGKLSLSCEKAGTAQQRATSVTKATPAKEVLDVR